MRLHLVCSLLPCRAPGVPWRRLIESRSHTTSGVDIDVYGTAADKFTLDAGENLLSTLPPSPPPAPPYECWCGWTDWWACPGAPNGGNFGWYATDDGSACYDYCCGASPSPPPPSPPRLSPSPPLEPSPPPALIEVHLVNSDSDEVIEKVAKENGGDMAETWQSLAEGGADLIGQLVAGNTPDPLKLAQTFIPVLAGMASPMLGAASAIVLSFCGAAFGGASEDVYTKVMAQLPGIIQESIIKQQMKEIGRRLMDIVDSSNFWSGIVKDDEGLRRNWMMNLENTLDDMKRTVFDACYDDPTSSDCKDWQTGGEVIHSVFFAGLHLHSITENANCYAGDTDKVKYFASLLRERGDKYMTLLRASYDTFRAHRLSQIAGAVVDSVEIPDCYPLPGTGQPICYPNWVVKVSGGTDSLTNTDILGQCGYPPRDRFGVVDHEYCKEDKQAKSCKEDLQSSVEACVANYSGDVTAHLDGLKSLIDAIQVLVDAAMCGVSTCTGAVLATMAEDPNRPNLDSGTCGDRIRWAMEAHEEPPWTRKSEADACQLVGEQFPSLCGPCAPNSI